MTVSAREIRVSSSYSAKNQELSIRIPIPDGYNYISHQWHRVAGSNFPVKDWVERNQGQVTKVCLQARDHLSLSQIGIKLEVTIEKMTTVFLR